MPGLERREANEEGEKRSGAHARAPPSNSTPGPGRVGRCVWMLGLAECGVWRMPSVCNAGRLTHTSGTIASPVGALNFFFSNIKPWSALPPSSQTRRHPR